jgi:hypothetical protein
LDRIIALSVAGILDFRESWEELILPLERSNGFEAIMRIAACAGTIRLASSEFASSSPFRILILLSTFRRRRIQVLISRFSRLQWRHPRHFYMPKIAASGDSLLGLTNFATKALRKLFLGAVKGWVPVCPL